MNVVLVAASTRLKIDWSQVDVPVDLVTTSNFLPKVRDIDQERARSLTVSEEENLGLLVQRALDVGSAAGISSRPSRLASFDEEMAVPLAQAREESGCVGPRPAQVAGFVDKVAMKERLTGVVPLPDYLPLPPHSSWPTHSVIATQLGVPYVIKPVDSGGSNGVMFIDSSAAWEEFQRFRIPGAHYEADTFLEGTLCHVDSVSRPGAVPQVMISEYTWPNAEFLRGKSIGSIPLAENDPRTEALRDLNVRALTALGAGHGVYHLEAFVPATMSPPVFLEVAARPAGGMVTELYDLVYGLNLHAAMLNAAGEDDGSSPNWAEAVIPSPIAYGMWLWVPPRAGQVLETRDPSTRGTVESYWRCRPGDELEPPRSVVDRVAGILITCRDAQEARADFELLRFGYRGLTTTRDHP